MRPRDAAAWDLGPEAQVTDPNDKGQIVGIGRFNGATTPFIATPVPEAPPWMLMLGGLGGLAAAARRRRRRPQRPDSVPTTDGPAG